VPDHPPPIPLPRSVCWRTCSAGRLPRTRVYWSRRPLTRRWGPVPLWVPAPARPRAVPQALVQRGGPPVHQAQAPVRAAGCPVRTPHALPPADPFRAQLRLLRLLRLPVTSPRLAVDAVPVLNGEHDAYHECRMWLPAEPVSTGKNGTPARTPSSCAPRSGALGPVSWGRCTGSSPADTGRAFGATSVFRSAGVPPGVAGPGLPKPPRCPRRSTRILPGSVPRVLDVPVFSARAASGAFLMGPVRGAAPCVRGAGPRGEVEARPRADRP